MKSVTFKCSILVDEANLEEVKRLVDHHVDSIIDLEGCPEIIAVWGATIVEEEGGEADNAEKEKADIIS